MVVAHHLAHLLMAEHLGATVIQRSDQRLGNDIAPAHDAERTLIIEIGDERMNRERCLAAFGSIKRNIACQYATQQRIGYDLIEHLTDATQLVGRNEW